MWTQKKVLQLAELMHAAPCLWDMGIKEYRDRTKKADAIEFIAAQLNAEQDEIIKKIKSLKTQFRREQNKKTIGKSGAAEDFSDKEWFAYNHLTFLAQNNDSMGSRSTMEVRFSM